MLYPNPLKNNEGQQGKFWRKKLIKNIENSLLLIDVHVKIRVYFSSHFSRSTPFSQQIRILHTENRLKISFGMNLEFFDKNSKIFQYSTLQWKKYLIFLKKPRFIFNLFSVCRIRIHCEKWGSPPKN